MDESPDSDRRLRTARRLEYEGLWDEAAHYKRARSSRAITSPRVTQLLRDRLDECLERHRGGTNCGRRELSHIFPDDEEIYLIDVKRLKLFKGLTSHRYVALSYVWGAVEQLCTLRANLGELLVQDSLAHYWNQLPLVVQDAIDLTNEMNERYLWVDSLCIVQDDAEFKYRQLDLMGEIYNCATATLVACSARDANNRLVTPEAAANVLQLDKIRPRGSVQDDVRGAMALETYIKRFPDAQIISDNLLSSHYNQRGWTFQERLLSKRRIYFLSNVIAFHCRNDLVLPLGLHDYGGLRSSEVGSDRFDSKLDALRLNELLWTRNRDSDTKVGFNLSGVGSLQYLDPEFQVVGGPATDATVSDGAGQAFRIWSDIIQEYSHKTFQYESDILKACAGVMYAFQGYSRIPVVHGIPKPLIHLALLWVPTSVVERRSTADANNNFPSWSWIGWKGGISFDIVKGESRVDSEGGKRVSPIEPITTAIEFFRTRIDEDTKVDLGKAYARSASPLTDSWVSFTYVPEDFTLFPSSPGSFACHQLAYYLHFQAFTREASAYITSAPPTEGHFSTLKLSNSMLLSDQVSEACGALYGIDDSQALSLREPGALNDKIFVLLSTMKRSYVQVAEKQEVQRDERGVGIPIPRPKVDKSRNWYTSGHLSAPSVEWSHQESARRERDLERNKICNIMLLQRHGDWYERIALGQMIKYAWDDETFLFTKSHETKQVIILR